MDLCSHAVKTGEKIGADEIEAVWVKEAASTIEAELGEISKASTIVNEAMKIRVIKDKALGLVLTYRLDRNGIESAVEKALAAASASKKDEKWDSLPAPGAYPHVEAWDPYMKDVDSEELMRPVIESLQLVPKDIAVHVVGNQTVLLEKCCANSSGIEHKDRGTVGLFGIAAVGKVDGGVTPAFQEVSFCRKYSPDPQRITESLVDRIYLFKKTEPASSGKFSIVLSPQALESLLRHTLFKALSGENVARGKTLLAGRTGEKIASSQLTLHDNGIIPEGIASQEMDDEGAPCQDTPLIEEGVLQGFIWNDYWAKRMGCTSTGNAHYNARDDEMVIQHTTMVITPGDLTEEELFDIKDGYYVLDLQGAHGSNPESGDFSVVCTPAYRIRNGEITGGVGGMMLSDNVFSLIQKIDAVGSESEVLEHTIFPPVRFSDVNVAAK